MDLDEGKPVASRGEQVYPDELVFGFVCAVGTQIKPIEAHLQSELQQFGYSVQAVKLSELLEGHADAIPEISVPAEPYEARVNALMDLGNALRKTSGEAIAAMLAVTQINGDRDVERGRRSPRARTAYILNSLKREEEVELLRGVYGVGFFLIGVYAPEQERLLSLQTQRGVGESAARKLIERDRDERDVEKGQRTSDTYALADVFVPQDPNRYRERLSRFVDLVFGHPFHTPSQDENGMFLAYSASLRSGDLSRQVGAALTTTRGDVLSVGCNDVPRFGGGLYWPGHEDQRDHIRGSDSNEKRRDEIIRDLIPVLRDDRPVEVEEIQSLLANSGLAEETKLILASDPEFLNYLRSRIKSERALPLAAAKEALHDTPIYSLTEFGRTVHAEMDALFGCARTGRSPVGSVLYTTTFPCHNCTRHIVTSGVGRVVYIEPYPKSLAFRLHFDSIVLNERGLEHQGPDRCRDMVTYEPFLGIGPRRYFDLFSLRLSSGRTLHRKLKRADGETIRWSRSAERPRVPLLASSYLEREEKVAMKVSTLLPEDLASS